MKKKLLGAAAVFLLAALVSCTTVNPWSGVYAGVISTADGEEINAKVTLNVNETYKVEYNDHTSIGKFTWNVAKDTIKMDVEWEDIPLYFKLGQKALIHLVTEGNIISGDVASDYILYKQR